MTEIESETRRLDTLRNSVQLLKARSTNNLDSIWKGNSAILHSIDAIALENLDILGQNKLLVNKMLFFLKEIITGGHNQSFLVQFDFACWALFHLCCYISSFPIRKV